MDVFPFQNTQVNTAYKLSEHCVEYFMISCLVWKMNKEANLHRSDCLNLCQYKLHAHVQKGEVHDVNRDFSRTDSKHHKGPVSCYIFTRIYPIDLVTVFDAILTSKQKRQKLLCLYGNLMSNNFHKTAVLKTNINCKLKPQSNGLSKKNWGRTCA